MKKITMSGGIGWEIMAYVIKEELNSAKGDDIEVDLSSSGGSVFEGVDIYHAFNDYKRQYPGSQMILNIKGIAASMGSLISSNNVFDIVTVEDTSSYMIHNPLMAVYGDYQEMEKGANFLKRLANMFVPIYAKRSKKDDKEIKKMMDAESWLFGKEIVDAGFADELIKTESNIDRNSAVAVAELNFKAVAKKVRELEIKDSDYQKVAAVFETEKPEPKKEPEKQSTEPAPSGKNNQEDELMNINELKDKHPEIHAEAIEAGKSQEKERVNSLLEMKKRKDFESIQAISDRIDEGIANGETMQSVELGLFALLRKDSIKAEMDSKEIGDIDGGSGEPTVSGEKANDPNAKKAQW